MRWHNEERRHYSPLGVYVSHFVTGPILELGETQIDGATLTLAPIGGVELKVAGFVPKANARDGSELGLAWAWSVAVASSAV